MFGDFELLSPFSLSPKMREEQEAKQKARLAARYAAMVPWTLNLSWAKQLNIQAATWPTWKLFDVEPTTCRDINLETDTAKKFAMSPGGMYMFCMRTLKQGALLETLQGSRRGDVLFDTPIDIPTLYERVVSGDNGDVASTWSRPWREDPWMSLTPMEVLSQRPGTRQAKGHVVVAGLGLGWGLYDVLRKRTVRKVTLVERSAELVDWVLPRVMDNVHRRIGKNVPHVEVIVGDARNVLWNFEADVALIDIFPRYGSNEFFVRDPAVSYEHTHPQKIETVWCWGAATLAPTR